MRENLVRTDYNEVYAIREYADGNIVFVLDEDEFVSITLRRYSDLDVIRFKGIYDNLTELMEIIENPIIWDVTSLGFDELIKKSKRAIDNYNKYIPEEIQGKFSFDFNKLEGLILSLQREFIKD